MTFTRSDLLAAGGISADELAGIADQLVAQGDPDPVTTSIVEMQAGMERYIHRYVIDDLWQKSLLRALVLWDLPKRLGKIPDKRQKAYDEAMKTLREIRDGKFPDVPLKATTPTDIRLPGGRYGGAGRVNTSRTAPGGDGGSGSSCRTDAKASVESTLLIAGALIGLTRIQILFASELLALPTKIDLPWVEKAASADDNVFAMSIDTITTTGYYVNLSGPAVAGQILHCSYLPA